MDCCLIVVALMAPRVVMVLILLLTNWFQQAYETILWPVLGFLFMPYTTLAYMAVQLRGAELKGWWLALLIFAVLVDVSHWGGSGAGYHKRYARE